MFHEYQERQIFDVEFSKEKHVRVDHIHQCRIFIWRRIQIRQIVVSGMSNDVSVGLSTVESTQCKFVVQLSTKIRQSVEPVLINTATCLQLFETSAISSLRANK